MRNFEKYIQEKADSFEMSPLPDSFDKVMAALEKKKKRRFLFWLWLIIPGFAIGSSFIVYKTLAENKNNEIQNSIQYSNGNTNTITYSNNTPVTTTNLQNTTDGNRTQQTSPENEVKNEIVKINLESNKTTENKKTNTIEHKDWSIEKSFSSQQKISNGNTEEHSNKSLNHTNTESKFVKNMIEPPREKTGFVLGINNTLMPVLGRIEHPSIYFPRQNVPSVQPYSPEFTIAKRKKFAVGAYADLGVCKSFYKANNDSAGGFYTGTRDTADRYLFSYSAGVQFRYSPFRNFAIETGIGFTMVKSNEFVANVFSTSSLQDNLSDTVMSFAASTPTTNTFHNEYGYISIPFKLLYQNRWNTIGFEAGGGVIFDIPVYTKAYVFDDNTGYSYMRKEVNGSRLNMFGIQAVANVNFIYYIKSFSLFAGPTFKYRLNSMFDDQYIIQQRPFFIGGQIGIRYNF